jgi:GTP-binding protein EngB required for normal cell division
MNNSELNNCANCPVHNMGNLKKLGIDMSSFDFVVALAGNPNTGKSTVFNYLTGLRQHTGNWPGKTVTRAEGGFEYSEKKFKLVDLPGTYSLYQQVQMKKWRVILFYLVSQMLLLLLLMQLELKEI